MYSNEVNFLDLSKEDRTTIYANIWLKGFVLCIIGVLASYLIQLAVGLMGGLIAKSVVTTAEGWRLGRNITITFSYIAVFAFNIIVMLPIYVRWLLNSNYGKFRISLVSSEEFEEVKQTNEIGITECATCKLYHIPISTDKSLIEKLKKANKWKIGRFDHGVPKEDWDAAIVSTSMSKCPRCNTINI